MKKLLVVVLAAAGLFLLAATSAQATYITSSANGVEFFDNFENETVGQVPNNPEAGAWAIGSDAGFFGAWVQDATSMPVPGPYQGSQFIRLPSTLAHSWTPAEADLKDTVTAGTIHAEWEAWIPQNAIRMTSFIDSPIVGLYSGAPDPTTHVGALRYYVTGTDAGDGFCGVNYLAGQWQKWSLDANMATQKYTVTVAGNTSAWLDFRAPASSVSSFTFYEVGGDGTSPWFMDSSVVPEPSTIVLLATGLMGLLAYAWRKRK